MRIKRAIAIMLLFILPLGAGCKAAESSAPRVTLIMKTDRDAIEFWDVTLTGVEAAAEELGIDLTVVGTAAETMVDEQIQHMEDAIRNKPDVIVLIATDYDRLAPVAQKAVDAGIKLLTLDSDVNCDDRLCFIASDNMEIGRLLGEQMHAALPGGGKVVIIGHLAETSTGIARVTGAQEQLATYDNIELIGTYYCDNYHERAKEIVMELMAAHPDIAGFIGTNEVSNLGVAYALEELGLEGKVKLVGCDNSQLQVQYLEKNTIQSIVIQRPFSMGYMAIEAASKVAAGEEVPAFIDSGCVMINRDNMYDPDNQKLLFPFRNTP